MRWLRVNNWTGQNAVMVLRDGEGGVLCGWLGMESRRSVGQSVRRQREGRRVRVRVTDVAEIDRQVRDGPYRGDRARLHGDCARSSRTKLRKKAGERE